MTLNKGSFIIGLFFLMLSAPFSLMGFFYTFDPPRDAIITVNEVNRYPGDPEFALGSVIFLIIGIFFLMISFGIIVSSFFERQGLDVPRSSLGYSDNISSSSYRRSSYKSSRSTNFSSSSLQTYCTSCGAYVKPKEKFCNNCGRKF